jgi:hypothetical protein
MGYPTDDEFEEARRHRQPPGKSAAAPPQIPEAVILETQKTVHVLRDALVSPISDKDGALTWYEEIAAPIIPEGFGDVDA